MFTIRHLVRKSTPMAKLWGTQLRAMPVCALRQFSTAAEMSTVEEDKELENMSEEEKLIAKSKKFGADLAFNERKHGYILSFPWNFDEVIQDYEHEFTPLDEKNFWYKWIYNREADRDFNELFRVVNSNCMGLFPTPCHVTVTVISRNNVPDPPVICICCKGNIFSVKVSMFHMLLPSDVSFSGKLTSGVTLIRSSTARASLSADVISCARILITFA